MSERSKLPRHSVALISIIFMVLCGGIVQATGIGSPYIEAERRLTFYPNMEREFTFQIQGAERLQIQQAGDLVNYSTIIDDTGVEGPRWFKVILKLPESLEEGTHVLYVGAIELAEQGATISATAAVRIPIYVTVLNSEPFLKASLVATDGNPEENITLVLGLQSWSYKEIPHIEASINIFEYPTNTMKETVTIQHDHLAPSTSVSIPVTFPAARLGQGDYMANATITYGENTTETNDAHFKIGTLEIYLINHTTTFYRNEINEFQLDIRSKWNHDLEDVYATIQIDKEGIQTPTLVLKPFSQETLLGYWNIGNVTVGPRQADVTINFQKTGQIKKRVNLEVVDRAQIESPFNLTPKLVTSILLIVIVIIIIADIIWLMRRKRSS